MSELAQGLSSITPYIPHLINVTSGFMVGSIMGVGEYIVRNKLPNNRNFSKLHTYFMAFHYLGTGISLPAVYGIGGIDQLKYIGIQEAEFLVGFVAAADLSHNMINHLLPKPTLEDRVAQEPTQPEAAPVPDDQIRGYKCVYCGAEYEAIPTKDGKNNCIAGCGASEFEPIRDKK